MSNAEKAAEEDDHYFGNGAERAEEEVDLRALERIREQVRQQRARSVSEQRDAIKRPFPEAGEERGRAFTDFVEKEEPAATIGTISHTIMRT